MESQQKTTLSSYVSQNLNNEEWESSVDIPLTLVEYLEAIQPHQNNGRLDIIFIQSDGVRVSRRRIERKVTNQSQRVLGALKPLDQVIRFFPILRKCSVETLEDINMHQSQLIVKQIIRLVVNHCCQTELPGFDGLSKCLPPQSSLRLSYDEEITSQGSRYYARAEIEYGKDLSWEERNEQEQAVMKALLPLHHHLDFDNMNAQKLHTITPPKLNEWHNVCIDQPYKWAYKWNGVKAKLAFSSDGTAYLLPDGQGVHCFPNPTFTQWDPIFSKTCLQVELMEDCAILVGVLCVTYNHDVYRVEQNFNLDLLSYIKSLPADSRPQTIVVPMGTTTVAATAQNRNINNVVVPLRIQEFWDNPAPDMQFALDHSLHDGLVIVQNNSIFKWKLPTLDVLCKKTQTGTLGLFVADHENVTHLVRNTGLVRLCENAVFEVGPDWRILRKRLDRPTASTAKEYERFKVSVFLFHKSETSSLFT